MHPNMEDIFGNGVYFGNLLELLQAVSNSLFIKSKEQYQDYLTTFTKQWCHIDQIRLKMMLYLVNFFFNVS